MKDHKVARNLSEEFIYAEESFIADVQFGIHNLIQMKGMSRADLARAMDISEARVSQIFSDNPRNLTLRTIARLFRALGEEPQITSATLAARIPVPGARKQKESVPSRGRHDEIVQELLRLTKARNEFKPEANDNIHERELVAA